MRFLPVCVVLLALGAVQAFGAAADGKAVYNAKCKGCHKPDGSGMAAMKMRPLVVLLPIAGAVLAARFAPLVGAAAQPRACLLYTSTWCALGAAGLAAWGILDGRAERVNLGVAGLGITVLVFYFSSVMDKLGRSASLMGLGLLFLGGGWVLERTRRRLLTHMSKEAI